MKTEVAAGRIILIVVAGLGCTISAAQAQPETYSKHVVVAQEGHAADAGREVLRRGGNAIDAAIATAFALAVTLPEAGNLGGGGFIVAYLADGGEVVTVDFREMAPHRAGPAMYLRSDHRLRPRYRAGAWAAGVPGTVRGLGLAHARFGKTPWAELVRPAVGLARKGFRISADLAGSLNRQLSPPDPRRPSETARDSFGRLGDFPESVAAFSKPDRALWRSGDRLVQRDLADTLDRIAANGPDEFYTGRTARLLDRYMAEHGGFVTLDDLKSYEAKLRPPVHTTFRGYDVYSIGPPSSGGVVLCQMLNILERFDLKADGRESPRTLHRVTEAMRRGVFHEGHQAGRPRLRHDPGRRADVEGLRRQLGRSIGEKATPSQELAPFPIQTAEGEHTTHLSVIDAAGNAVALTYTLEESYGAKCVVAGAGFLLNNEMGDFNLIPDRTDTAGRIGTPANLIAPRKRMLSSQTPTLVLKDGTWSWSRGRRGGGRSPTRRCGWCSISLSSASIRVRPSTPLGPTISGFRTSYSSRAELGPRRPVSRCKRWGTSSRS